MVRDSGSSEDPLSEETGEAASERRKRRVKVRRRKEKLPPALRIALLVGGPVAVWFGILFAGRALL